LLDRLGRLGYRFFVITDDPDLAVAVDDVDFKLGS